MSSDDAAMEAAQQTSLASDPIVTGERKGLIPLLVDILGSLIALLYGLFEKLGYQLNRLRTATVRELREFNAEFAGYRDRHRDVHAHHCALSRPSRSLSGRFAGNRSNRRR